MYIHASKAMHRSWRFGLVWIVVSSFASLGHKCAVVQGSHVAIFDDVERDECDDRRCEELIDSETIRWRRGIGCLRLTVAL